MLIEGGALVDVTDPKQLLCTQSKEKNINNGRKKYEKT